MKCYQPLVWLTTLALVAGCSRSGPIGATGAAGENAVNSRSGVSEVDRALLPALAQKAAAARQGAAPPIVGRVEFPPIRTTQAAVGDVINYATVSLIDTNQNRTVATTATNSNGGFNLSLAGFMPETNTPYLVEASKGLMNNVPGYANPRFRTIVKFNGTAWESITKPSVVISNQSTAVAIEAGLYSDIVQPGRVMNAVDVSVRPAGFTGDSIFMTDATVKNAGHTVAELVKLSADIQAFLTGDVDPVGAIPEVAPAMTDVSIDHGKPKDLVTIGGRGFSPLVGGNTVTFNGTPATILLASTRQLIVSVPDGATSGQVMVKTNRGTVPTGRGFTIDASGPSFAINFAYPNQGTPGTDVTILGFGFSKTPAENTVYFDTVTTTCITSDTSFCTCKIPNGATQGPVSVKVGEGTSNTLPFTVLSNAAVTSYFPNTGAPRQDIVISGENLGTVQGSVKISGVDATILSWANGEVVAAVPLGTVTGDLTLAKPGLPAVLVGTFTVLSGNLTSWATTTNTAVAHNGGWHARHGQYLYAGGGYATCCGGPTSYNKVTERVKVNADGTLGTWEVLDGVEVPYYWNMYAVYDLAHQSSAIGDYAYVFGGYDHFGNQAAHTTVLRARFFPDGSMSQFAAAPVQLASPVNHGAYSLRVKQYAYVFGSNSPISDVVQGAKINADGTLQAFTKVGQLPWACQSCQFVNIGKYVYLLGGYNAAVGHNGWMYRATVDSNGLITGSWSDLGRTLPHEMYSGNVAVIGNYVYLFWGLYPEVGWTNNVYRAQIQANDDLGTWESVAGQPFGKHYANLWAIGSRVYVDGAYDGNHRLNIDVGTIQ